MAAVTVTIGGSVPKPSTRAIRLGRASTALLATITTLGTVAVQPAVARIETPVPSAGFRDDTVITGRTLPSTIKFAPNGR